MTNERSDKVRALILSALMVLSIMVGSVAFTGSAAEQLFVYGFADFLELAESAVKPTDADFDNAKVENFG